MSLPDRFAPILILMGSQSDWSTMRAAAEICDILKIQHEAFIASAHRTPERMNRISKTACSKGAKVIIAGAGGAAHLPGMIAAQTNLPVLGVPVQSKSLQGLDSLLSIVQMPGGVPVGSLAIGAAGAKNAGLLAASILSLNDPDLATRLAAYRAEQTHMVALRPV